MKITKYEHACWEIVKGQTRLIIDPGVFSDSLTDFGGITAVVITHVHNDHFDAELIQRITKENPKVRIFGPRQVAAELSDKTTTPALGEIYQVGDLSLEFFGEKHHLFADTENIAVCVDQEFFVPGDSYTKPDKPVKVSAVPASAPWLRIDEAIANVEEIEAKTVVPTHNALLSEIGESIHYRILSGAAEKAGKVWLVMKTKESIEI